MSYNGGIDFGLLGDYDALPDLDELGSQLEESLAELVAAARARAGRGAGKDGAKVRSRARTSRPRTSSPATKGA